MYVSVNINVIMCVVCGIYVAIWQLNYVQRKLATLQRKSHSSINNWQTTRKNINMYRYNSISRQNKGIHTPTHPPWSTHDSAYAGQNCVARNSVARHKAIKD